MRSKSSKVVSRFFHAEAGAFCSGLVGRQLTDSVGGPGTGTPDSCEESGEESSLDGFVVADDEPLSASPSSSRSSCRGAERTGGRGGSPRAGKRRYCVSESASSGEDPGVAGGSVVRRGSRREASGARDGAVKRRRRRLHGFARGARSVRTEQRIDRCSMLVELLVNELKALREQTAPCREEPG